MQPQLEGEKREQPLIIGAVRQRCRDCHKIDREEQAVSKAMEHEKRAHVKLRHDRTN